MKKQDYMKPAMRVVKIQQHVHILAGSQMTIQMYGGSKDYQIDDEDEVW